MTITLAEAMQQPLNRERFHQLVAELLAIEPLFGVEGTAMGMDRRTVAFAAGGVMRLGVQVRPHEHRWVTAVLIARAADFRPLGVVERDFAVMGDSERDGNLYDLSKVFCADCGEQPE